MSSRVVDYDTIINIQTLSWTTYDTEVIFDLANHEDFDVHVSLLYDVGEDTAEDYTGVRVGYPAGSDDRLGFLTPPQSPRKFQEETIDELVGESSHSYIGNIAVSPTGTRRGIKQALVLQNSTGVAELLLTDSPIMNEIGKTFDATEWMDQVTPIADNIRAVKDLPKDTLFTSFDKLEFLHRIDDTVEFSFDEVKVSGDVILRYYDDKLHIKDAYVKFMGDWDPQDYELYGVGDWINAKSPLKLSFTYQHDSHKNFHRIQNTGSIRFYLLVRDRSVLTGETDYRWVSFDYGFGISNWRSVHVKRDNYMSLARSLPGIPKWGLDIIPRIDPPVSLTDNLSKSPMAGNMGLSNSRHSNILQYSFGNVIAGHWYDTIEPPQPMKMSLSNIITGATHIKGGADAAIGFLGEDIISAPQTIDMGLTNIINSSPIIVSW